MFLLSKWKFGDHGMDSCAVQEVVIFVSVRDNSRRANPCPVRKEL